MLFVILLGVILSAGLIGWFLSWCIHIDMNKMQNNPYGWGNFNKFLNQFNSYNNWYINNWKGSFFDKNGDFYNYYINEDIIIFNGKCMILDPISWLRFIFWRNKKWNEISKLENKNRKVKW